MNIGIVSNNPQMPVAQTPPSTALVIWRKICAIAKKIFDFLYFWKKPDYELTPNQNKIIDEARSNARQRIPVPPPTEDYDDSNDDDVVRNPEPVVKDQSLKQLLGSLTEFGSVISECLKSEMITPSVEDWKENAAKLPDVSKQWVKMFMDVKKYLDPIFARFPNADEPLVMTLIQLFCSVLLENKTQQEIESEVTDKINELHQKNLISEDLHQRLISAIQPTLTWIIQSNKMILKSINPIQLHELLIDTKNFFIKFSEMLLKGDLDPIIEEIQGIIEEHLDESLENLLDDNNHVLGNVLGSRIVDLIQNMPYTDTFDELINRINTHLDAWIIAEGKRIAENKTIQAAEESLRVYPDNANQDPKKKFEEYLEIVEGAGGAEEYLAQKFINDFRDAYAKKYPNSVPLITPPPAGMTSEMAEEEEYNLFAEKLYRLLLPSGKYELPYDIHLEQDGLAQIWEQIALPERLKQIENKLLALFDTVLEKIEPKNEENFKAYFFLFLKTFVFYHIRENKLIPLIKKGIMKTFEKFSEPASIRKIFSETIFPRVSDKLFELFARQVISKNSNTFAPLFRNLIEAPGNRVLSAKKAVISKIEEVLEGKFKEFNWEMMDRERVPTIIMPIILEITQVLQNLKALDPTKTLQEAEVAKAIEKFYISEKVETKREFGDVIMKLLYEIGNFGESWKGYFISYYKETLAQAATAGFKNYRSSFHALVNTIVQAGETHYLNEDYVKATFFEQIEADYEGIDEQLPEQIRAIATQTHDMLYDGPGGYFTPAAESLNATIQRIFKEIFKRKEINKNLVYQFFQVLENSFKCSQDLLHRVQLISNN